MKSPVMTPRKKAITPLFLEEYKANQNSKTLKAAEPDHILPIRILDAPGLEDDYYLNLLSWSSENILAVGLSNRVHLWNALTGESSLLITLKDKVTSLAWSPRGVLAIGGKAGTIALIDPACPRPVPLTTHSARVGVLSWNGNVLTSGSRDRSLLHHDPRLLHCRRVFEAHEQEICGLQWDRAGRLASGGNDNVLQVWDERSSKPLHRWTEHKAAVKAIAWSPERSGILASGGGTADRCIRLWSLHTGLISTHPTASQVCALAWSGSELCSTHGFSEHLCLRWDMGMRITGVMRGHTQRVLYLAKSPDGVSVATGSADETIRIWPVFSPVTKTGHTGVLDTIDHR